MSVIRIWYSTWTEEESVTYRDVAIDEALACFFEVYGSLVPGDNVLISVSCEG